MTGSHDGRPPEQDGYDDILAPHQGFPHAWRRQVPPPLHHPAAPNGRARAEQNALAHDNLDAVARKSEHGRAEHAKHFLHRSVIGASRVVLIVFGIFFVTWAWHVLCPTSLEFVPQEKFGYLTNLIHIGFGGIGGALLTRFLSKHGF